MTNPFKTNPKLKDTLIRWCVYSFLVFFTYFFTFAGNIVNEIVLPNFAKEAAKPIEKALIESGARKVCEDSYKGFGISDRPRYAARFEINRTQEETIKLLQSTASQNGFNQPRFFENGTSSSFVDESVKSTNFLLREGRVKLSYETYSQKKYNPETDSLYCTISDGELPSATSFSLDVILPSHKKLY